MRPAALIAVALTLSGCASKAPEGVLYRQPAGVYRGSNPAEAAGAPGGFAVVTGPKGDERHGYGATPDEAARHAGASSWQTAEPIETADDEVEACPGGVCRVPGPEPVAAPPPPAAEPDRFRSILSAAAVGAVAFGLGAAIALVIAARSRARSP